MDPGHLIDSWKSQFPDEDSFRERLDRDDLTAQTVREHARATRFPADEPLPDWIATLEELVEHVQTCSLDERSRARGDEVPFAELLVAIATFASERLPENRVPMDALEPLVEWLIRRLERICVRPLYVEFKSFVAHHNSERARADPETYAEPPTTYYERFLEVVFDDGFADLCHEYPVLARHVVRLVEDWTAVVLEISHRIRSDRGILREHFDVRGAVTSLRPLARETHSGGRTPIRVSFDGTDVVYKPKSIDTGIAFYTILDGLAERCSIPPFETPTYVSRDGYGWMEAIEYHDPTDDTAVDRYYERAGALVCLAYVLNVIDLQFENVLTDGAQPTIVDTETIFHPVVDPTGKHVDSGLGTALDRSVYLTGLLPVDAGVPNDFDGIDFGIGTRPNRENERCDGPTPREKKASALAGLGNRSGEVRLSVRTRPIIEAVNTDVMSVTTEPVTRDGTTNTPTVNGDDRPPADHVGAIVRGFDRTYREIAELHTNGTFLSEIVPRELIAGVENRLVYRPTHRYDSVLRRMGGREPLRDGVRSTVEMEALAVPFFDGSIDDDGYWPMYAAERSDLRRLDVPRFTSYIDRRTVIHKATGFEVSVDESGYERCRRRLEGMNDGDRCRQRWLIRRCYEDPQRAAARTPPAAGNATADRIRREAVDLCNDVLDAAIDTGDGLSWTFIDPRKTKTARLVQTDDSLFCGRGGIALTAAALYRVTGRNRYREAVEEAFDPTAVRRSVERDVIGLGGTTGIGSVIYCSSTIGTLLEDDRYRRNAIDAARSVTEDRIVTADRLGVQEGVAGTLLALLACYERFGDATVLERARLCGDRLVRAALDDDDRAWRTAEERRRETGFARGPAGIAYALTRLATAAGDLKYTNAARNTLVGDPTLTLSVPDPTRRGHDERGLKGWCRGHSALFGIGLAEHLRETTVLDGATTLLSTTARSELSPLDNLYCGNFGRIAAVLEGSIRADGDIDPAIDLIERCLSRKEREGTYSLTGHSRTVVNPTFFGGVSGLSYTLLRLHEAENLPCVLLLE